jgi:hypothetical protein
MNTRAFKASWIILVVLACLTILSGLVLIVAPELFLADEFTGYAGQPYAQFAAANPAATSFFMLEAAELGIFMIALNVALMIVTLCGYRQGLKWAWWLALFIITVGIGGPVLADIPTNAWQVTGALVVMLVAGWIALALGAGPILRPAAEPAA